MRLLTILTTLLMLALISCEKDADNIPTGNPPGSNYFIRFKLNDTLREFTDQSTLLAFYTQGQLQHLLQTSTSNSINNSTFAINIWDGKTIVPDTFSGYSNQGTYFYGASFAYGEDGAIYGTNGANPVSTIFLEEFSATEAKGSFNGTIIRITGSGPSSLSITDGEFFVKRGN